jgi:hypothetical protein
MGALRVGSDGEAGKTLIESFERVSVKAMPEPSPAEGVGGNGAAIVAEGETSPNSTPNSSLHTHYFSISSTIYPSSADHEM